MKVFGVSLVTILIFAAVFIVGAKYGGGIVSKLPVVGDA